MIQLPRLVGVCGAAGCGKDLAADFLRTRYGFDKYQMAGPLKRGLEAMFPNHISPATWESDAKEQPLPRIGMSPRVLAQTLGTEWGRGLINKDVWLNLLANHWAYMNEGTFLPFRPVPSLVVSDIRFDNEARWILDNGGVIIKVVRPVGRDVPPHASEAGIHGKYIDSIVSNDVDVATFLQRFSRHLEVLNKHFRVEAQDYE